MSIPQNYLRCMHRPKTLLNRLELAKELAKQNDDKTQNPGPNPQLERHSGNGSLAAGEVQETRACRILVSVVSIRECLCDEDNLCEKFIVDCLRYCGAIPQDSPETVSIITTQRKAEKGEEEHTEITITYP